MAIDWKVVPRKKNYERIEVVQLKLEDAGPGVSEAFNNAMRDLSLRGSELATALIVFGLESKGYIFSKEKQEALPMALVNSLPLPASPNSMNPAGGA